MTSRAAEEAIDAVAAGLRATVRRLEAEAQELVQRADGLYAEAEQVRQTAVHQKEVLAHLEGPGRHIVSEHVNEHLTAGRVGSDSGDRRKDTQRAAVASTAADGGASGRTPDGDTAGSGPTMTQQVLDVLGSEPSHTWTAARLRESLPQMDMRMFNKILARLHSRGQVVRVSKGQYRVATTKDTTEDTVSAASAADVQSQQSGEIESLGSGLSQLSKRIVARLRSGPMGQSWRLDELAAAVSADVASVHAELQGLLRAGEVVTAIDGSYLIPRERMAAEGWAHVG